MAWLADARIDRPRVVGDHYQPVENIGRLTGLGAPASVRAAFHRRLGISPRTTGLCSATTHRPRWI